MSGLAKVRLIRRDISQKMRILYLVLACLTVSSIGMEYLYPTLLVICVLVIA